MSSNPPGQYQVQSRSRQNVFEFVLFDTNGGSDPDGLFDVGNVAQSVTRVGVGLLRVTLPDLFHRICATVSIEDSSADVFAELGPVVDGTAATNTVDIRTVSGGALADLTDKTIHLHLGLIRGPRTT